jgi:putative PIN family toxin of toxin-antitoxin system
VTRAVFDPNVLVAAALVRDGAPAECLRAHADGRFELLVSERLLGELASVLAREKFRRYLSLDQAQRLVAALRRDAVLCADPAGPPPVSSPDPDDDYLLALALAHDAHVLVSGDAHLLELRTAVLRICSPREFLSLLPG